MQRMPFEEDRAENQKDDRDQTARPDDTGLSNTELPSFREIDDSAGVSEFLAGRFQAGRDYLCVKFMKTEDQLVILGIPDQKTSAEIASALIPKFPEFRDVSRLLCGKSWSVWLPYEIGISQQNLSSPDFEPGVVPSFPELTAVAQRAREVLSSNNILPMSDYAQLDTDNSRGGIEVGGVQNEELARRIHSVLVREFPELLFTWRYVEGRADYDPGHHVCLHSFPKAGTLSDKLFQKYYMPSFNVIKNMQVSCGRGFSAALRNGGKQVLNEKMAELSQKWKLAGIHIPNCQLMIDEQVPENRILVQVPGKSEDRVTAEVTLEGDGGVRSLLSAIQRATLSFQEHGPANPPAQQ